jgi:hypothetical protein
MIEWQKQISAATARLWIQHRLQPALIKPVRDLLRRPDPVIKPGRHLFS